MYIVFDIGGTKMRVASSEDGVNLTRVEIVSTPKHYERSLPQLIEEINLVSDDQTITSIVGGVPGNLNEDKTVILHAANLPDWSGKTLAADLHQNFNCPVKIENDGILAALAEASIGAGKDFKSVAYVTVGTGIGGAWVVDKKIAPYDTNFDIGHQVIDPNGPLCPGHQEPGHLEAYLKQKDFLDYLVIGLRNALQYWPSEVIILGGGVTLHNHWQLSEIKTKLQALLPPETECPEILFTKLGDEAGLYGALKISQ